MKLGVPVISHMFYSGNPCNKLLGTVKEREEERSAERVGHAGVAGLPAPPQLPPEHPAARSAVPPHLEPQVLQPLRRSAFFRICSDKVTALRGALSYAIVVAISISADIYSAKQCGIGLTLQKAAHEGGLITLHPVSFCLCTVSRLPGFRCCFAVLRGLYLKTDFSEQ